MALSSADDALVLLECDMDDEGVVGVEKELLVDISVSCFAWLSRGDELVELAVGVTEIGRAHV